MLFWGFKKKSASRAQKDDGHIIITGTGRAGTTALVQVLTHLGHDTGYSREQSLKNVNSISHAGLERSLFSPNLPKIIKSPWIIDELQSAIDSGIKISHAIVPMRNLEHATQSRLRVSAEYDRLGRDPLNAPGGLWLSNAPDGQAAVLLEQFYKLLEVLVRNDIPTIFLWFPKFTEDINFFYRKMLPIVGEKNSFDEFSLACNEVFKPSKVHFR